MPARRSERRPCAFLFPARDHQAEPCIREMIDRQRGAIAALRFSPEFPGQREPATLGPFARAAAEADEAN